MREDAARPAAGGPVSVPRWAYWVVTILSLLLGAEAVVRGTRTVQTIADSDLTNFFLPSASYILRGDPWHMYAVRGIGLIANDSPPLSMFLYAPLLALARAVGFTANYGEVITFVSLPFIIVVPLLGLIVLAALRRLYPQMPDAQRFLAYALVVLSPLAWLSIGSWYHPEQPLMLCFLAGAAIALQRRREALAGLLAGLGLLTSTTAMFPLLALGLLPLLERRWRATVIFGGIAVVVAGIGMAPFFLFDRPDTTYSFLTWRGGAEIGGNSIWSIFASSSATGIRYTINAIAKRLDMPSMLIFVAGVSVLANRRLRVSVYSRDMWAVLALASLAVPMLSKRNWPYYYLEPFIFLLVWEFTTMHDRLAGLWRWPVLSVGFLLAAATLAQYLGLKSVGALDRIVLGLLEFGAMLAFAVAIWVRMRAAKQGVSPGPAMPAAGDPRMALSAASAANGRMPLPDPAAVAGAQPLRPGGGHRPASGPAPGPAPAPQSPWMVGERVPPPQAPNQPPGQVGPAPQRGYPGAYPPSPLPQMPNSPGGSPGRIPPPLPAEGRGSDQPGAGGMGAEWPPLRSDGGGGSR